MSDRKLTRDEEAEEIIRRLKAPPLPHITVEKIEVRSHTRKLSQTWTYEENEEVEIDFSDGVIDELTKALTEEIIGKPETSDIKIVKSLVRTVKPGKFLDELHKALEHRKKNV
jgi:hypothetical protein